MADFTADTVNKFSAFLAEKDKEIKNQTSPFIISFAVEAASNQFPDPVMLTGAFDISLHYEKPSEYYKFTALGSCIEISENGSSRFPASIKKIKDWQTKLVSNINVDNNGRSPLFVGGVKFTSERSDEAWKEFSDSVWFLPDYLFFTQNGGASKLFINFTAQPGSSPAGLAKKYEAKLALLNQIKTADIKTHNNLKVLNTAGNTPKDKKKWKLTVDSVLENIESGEVDKVVLSRKIELLFSEEACVLPLYERLKSEYKDLYNFILKRGSSYFFGASPERLASFNRGELLVEALAGSAPNGNSPAEKEVIIKEKLFSAKNLNEHKYVVDYIATGIKEFSERVNISQQPMVKELPNIMHLATEIRAELKDNIHVLSVIEKLFPTPAVCGAPGDKALQFIKKYETHQRGLYSGLIGWFNFFDEGEFIISIRSALLNGKKLNAYAGCGIVRDSEAAEEFAETELKLEPILSLFR